MDHARNVFVVHGRNLRARDEVCAFLRALDLNPLEWEEIVSKMCTGAPSVYEIVATGIAESQAVLVLLTGDDLARLNDGLLTSKRCSADSTLAPQPRQNVLFEAGLAFGLKREKTVLVRVGPLREMSDVSGMHYVQLSNSPQDRAALRSRLQTIGCSINEQKNDWLKVGDFDDLIPNWEQPEALAALPGLVDLRQSSKLAPDYAQYYFESDLPMTVCLFDGRVWFKRRHELLTTRFQRGGEFRVALVDPQSPAARYRATIAGKDQARVKEDVEYTVTELSRLAKEFRAPLEIYMIASHLPYTLVLNDERATAILYKINESWGSLPVLSVSSESPVYHHFKDDFYSVLVDLPPVVRLNWPEAS